MPAGQIVKADADASQERAVIMAEINFELYNNQLVQQLVGPQDANLKLIEQLLNVTIGSFGNQITIQGNGEAVEQARTAIDML